MMYVNEININVFGNLSGFSGYDTADYNGYNSKRGKTDNSKSKRCKTIVIDGISFHSFDAALTYLINDGMSSEEAFRFLMRKEDC